MRIIAISILSVFAVAVLITMARIWGDSQPHRTFEHEFFNGSTPLIITKVATLDEARAAVALKEDVVLWVNVRFSKDKVAFILPKSRDAAFFDFKKTEQEKHPETPIFTGGRLAEYSWEQINEFYKTTPALRELYQQFPKTRFVVNLIDNVSEANLMLVEAIEKEKPNARTLVQSDALILMTATKELKPEWVYGTSVPDLMRFLTLDSMFILSATMFKGDVFISPFELLGRPAFNEAVITEIQRRQIRIFLGPIQNEAQLRQAQGYNSFGLITDNLPELLHLLNQGPVQ